MKMMRPSDFWTKNSVNEIPIFPPLLYPSVSAAHIPTLFLHTLQCLVRTHSGKPAHPVSLDSAVKHNARITTIDSFCLFVLRNQFHTIGLDPGFRIRRRARRIKSITHGRLPKPADMSSEQSAAGGGLLWRLRCPVRCFCGGSF